MMRIAVYGNCQAGPIGRLIEWSSPGTEVVRLPPVHTISKDGVEALTELLGDADVILSQPITTAGFGKLSTDALKERFPDRQWVIYPTIYFRGLFPQLIYIRKEDHSPLRGPLKDYHDRRIVEAWLAGADEAECLKLIASEGDNGLMSDYRDALDESTRREELLPIKVMPFVRERIRSERLFHTFNHPSNTVLWNVVEQAARLIGFPSNPDYRPPKTQFLDEVSAATPPELALAVGLEYRADHYAVDREIASMRTLVAGFYELYRLTEGFVGLCARSGVAGASSASMRSEQT